MTNPPVVNPNQNFFQPGQGGNSTVPVNSTANPNANFFQSGQGGNPLPVASAPTSATNINQTSSVTIPSATVNTPGTSGVDGMVSYYKSLFDTASKQASDAQAAETAAKATQGTETKGFLDKILGAKSPSDVTANATAQTGIDPATYFADEKARIAEIDTLNNQYNDLVANRDNQIAALTGQGRGIPLDLLNNQAAQITRNAAPAINSAAMNINSKAAALQASQGMFQEAQQYIDKAVAASTADLKYNVDMYTMFYQKNQDVIDKLDTKYQSALTQATSAAKSAYDLATTNASAIGKLMIDPDLAGAGITLNDSIEQAQQKASTYLQSHPTIDTQYKLAQINALNNKTPSTGTEAERQASAISTFQSRFVPGAVMSNGIPVLDNEGKATPEAWKAALADAPAQGLTREAFIKQFASYIVGSDGKVSGKYGLTPKEISDLGATSK